MSWTTGISRRFRLLENPNDWEIVFDNLPVSRGETLKILISQAILEVDGVRIYPEIYGIIANLYAEPGVDLVWQSGAIRRVHPIEGQVTSLHLPAEGEVEGIFLEDLPFENDQYILDRIQVTKRSGSLGWRQVELGEINPNQQNGADLPIFVQSNINKAIGIRGIRKKKGLRDAGSGRFPYWYGNRNVEFSATFYLWDEQ